MKRSEVITNILSLPDETLAKAYRLLVGLTSEDPEANLAYAMEMKRVIKGYLVHELTFERWLVCITYLMKRIKL